MSTHQSFTQNLIVNGSFELPAQPTNFIASLLANTNLPGWKITGTGSVYLIRTPLVGWDFTPVEGEQFLDLNQPTVTVSQTFPTLAGEYYEVTFSAGRFQHRNMTAFAEVTGPGGELLGAASAFVPETGGWLAPTRFRFAAAADTATLSLRSSNATVNVDLAVDAVSVEPVSRQLTIEVAQVRVCWETVTNRLYQLQYRSELTANQWVDAEPPVAGTGQQVCIDHAVAQPRRFYRTVLLPAQ